MFVSISVTDSTEVFFFLSVTHQLSLMDRSSISSLGMQGGIAERKL
jgi:hypothetical protein